MLEKLNDRQGTKMCETGERGEEEEEKGRLDCWNRILGASKLGRESNVAVGWQAPWKGGDLLQKAVRLWAHCRPGAARRCGWPRRATMGLRSRSWQAMTSGFSLAGGPGWGSIQREALPLEHQCEIRAPLPNHRLKSLAVGVLTLIESSKQRIRVLPRR